MRFKSDVSPSSQSPNLIATADIPSTTLNDVRVILMQLDYKVDRNDQLTKDLSQLSTRYNALYQEHNTVVHEYNRLYQHFVTQQGEIQNLKINEANMQQSVMNKDMTIRHLVAQHKEASIKLAEEEQKRKAVEEAVQGLQDIL